MPPTAQLPVPSGIRRMPSFSFSVPGKRTGLTLLELLAVIVVLITLWAFVFPATDAIRRASRRRQALAEAHSLATATLLYRDTYGHWPLQAQAGSLDLDFVYGTNLLADATSVTLLDQAELIRALTPGDSSHTNNPRSIAFLEIDADRLHNGYFLDPWSTPNNPMPYVVAVDANGDGWIGGSKGERINGMEPIEPIEIQQSHASTEHTIPAIQEPVYVFSWSGTDTNRVSTLRQP